MPLQKLQFRPGVNREGTDYSNEGGWYDCNNIRFRSGFPEKIGGWTQYSVNTFLGYCRSMWSWVDLSSNVFLGVGTDVKYYIEQGGVYNDITPVYYPVTTISTSPATYTLTNPFTTVYSTLNGSITATSTSITLTSASAFPISGLIKIDSEQILYTTLTGNVLSGLTRGYNGTTAASHASSAGVGSAYSEVTDAGYLPNVGDYVIYSGATAVNGITLNGQYVVTNVNISSTTIYYIANVPVGTTTPVFSTATATGGGTVTTSYLYPSGANFSTSGTGWSTGAYSRGTYSSAYATSIATSVRLWTADNYGQDLVLAPRGGGIYYWQDSGGITTRAVTLSSVANANAVYIDTGTSFSSGVTSITVSVSAASSIYPYSYITGTGIPNGTYVTSAYVHGSTTVPISATTTANSSGSYSYSFSGAYVPTTTNQVLVAPIQEFVIAMGANSYNGGTLANNPFNPLLVRWSDQANIYQWVPSITNQSGEFPLANGSYIVEARSTRQEILIWTDSALYSMQYIGTPYIWGFQILMDNITIMSPQSAITVNNITYWMGRDKFYVYSGTVQTLPCSVRQYVFDGLNISQAAQFVSGSNEAYNEVWWFYCSANSSIVDSYVVYNYLDQVWYYGQMSRTAWFYSSIKQYPIAAGYNNVLLNHESGVDDVSTGNPQPIDAYVQSSDFDIGDGHNFGFVWRILPDVNFNGSYANQPYCSMTLKPRENSGTAYGQADNPTVQSSQNYTNTRLYNIQQFTGQVYTRLRGRQMAFRLESNSLGVAWQLGSPRMDIRPDGRR